MFRVLTGWLMLSLINYTTSSEEFCLTKCKVYVEPSVCNGEPCVMENIETGQGVFNMEECETICDEDTETCDSEAVKVTGTERVYETVYTIAKCVPLNSEEGMEQEIETDQETDPITAANSVTTDGDAVTAQVGDFATTEKPAIVTKCAKCRNPGLSKISCFDDPDDDEECPDGEACYIFPISSPVTITIEHVTIEMTDHFEMCVQVDQVNKNSGSVCKWDQCDLEQNFHEKGNVPVEPTTERQTTVAKTTPEATSPAKATTLAGAVDGCDPACTGDQVACHKVTWTSKGNVEYKCYKINTGSCGTSCTWKICDNVGGPCENEGSTAMSTAMTTKGESAMTTKGESAMTTKGESATNNAVETTESQDNNYDTDAAEEAVEDKEDSSSSSLSHIKGIIIALITYLLRA